MIVQRRRNVVCVLAVFAVCFILHETSHKSSNALQRPHSRLYGGGAKVIDEFPEPLDLSQFGPKNTYRLLPGSRSIIFGDMPGRLGNQMSEYATLWFMYRNYGFIPMMTRKHINMIRAYFKHPQIPVLEDTIPMYRFKVRKELSPAALYPKYMDGHRNYVHGKLVKIPDGGTEIFMGEENMQSVRKEFEFKDHLKDFAQNILTRARQVVLQDSTAEPTFVGVHIRRQDYGNHMWHLWGTCYVPLDFFSDAMNHFRDRYPNCIFVFVSDDLKWVKQNVEDVYGDVIFAGEESVTPYDPKDLFQTNDGIGRDLAILSHCNHSIFDYGTYGLWGGLLAGGEVYYAGIPNRLDQEDLLVTKQLTDLDLPGWTMWPKNREILVDKNRRVNSTKELSPCK